MRNVPQEDGELKYSSVLVVSLTPLRDVRPYSNRNLSRLVAWINRFTEPKRRTVAQFWLVVSPCRPLGWTALSF